MNYTITFSNGSSIEVMGEDFSAERVSREARYKLAFTDGWRLPSIGELKAIYEKFSRDGQGSFKPEWYWSSSYFYVSWDYSPEMGLDFNTGEPNAKLMGFGSMSSGMDDAYVRLVRNCSE